MRLQISDLIVKHARPYFETHLVLPAGVSDFIAVTAEVAIVQSMDEMFGSEEFDKEHSDKLYMRLKREIWGDDFVPDFRNRVMDHLAHELIYELGVDNYDEQIEARQQLIEELEIHPTRALMARHCA